jgi:5-methylcytosine-specific restriction endonuclease McrA
MRAWRAAKKTERLEVNHRIPCRGKHGTLSCDHHLENLETLCMICHKRFTRIDRKTSAVAGGV